MRQPMQPNHTSIYFLPISDLQRRNTKIQKKNHFDFYALVSSPSLSSWWPSSLQTTIDSAVSHFGFIFVLEFVFSSLRKRTDDVIARSAVTISRSGKRWVLFVFTDGAIERCIFNFFMSRRWSILTSVYRMLLFRYRFLCAEFHSRSISWQNSETKR